ncbi:hypothetical protein [Butyrivibrio fibrisolvens]|uniref:hypothetical protein n=1 Tax=Butyrivibrio fibrisolvens TaxID=831 RepID=UPI0003B47CEB|nr:hypothetical protein [Butyrivibrio fibrisolvens]
MFDISFKRNRQLKILLIILLLLPFQLLGVVHISKIMYLPDFINMMTIIISVVIIVLLRFKPIKIKKYAGAYYYWGILSIIIWLCEIIYSYILYSHYGQSLLSCVKASYSYCVIIVIYVLSYFLFRINDVHFLKNCIKAFGMLSSLFSIIQVILYRYSIVVFDMADEAVRNGRLRYGIASNFLPLAFFITFSDFVEKRKRKDFFIIVLEAIALLYAFQTRSLILYMVLTILIVLLVFAKKIRTKLVLMFSLAIISVYAIGTDLTNPLVFEFSNDYGIEARFYAIIFYLKQFLEKPLFGMGSIRESSGNAYLKGLLHGSSGVFSGKLFRDDVGVIGLLNERGIIGIAWYLLLLLILFKECRIIAKSNISERIWVISIYIYILISSFNLLYVENSRLVVCCFICSLIHHYYLNTNKTLKYSNNINII